MKATISFVVVQLTLLSVVLAQRVVPGVNPNHYQQDQHYQQQQQVQYQQPPQQQQQQFQQQQPPPQQYQQQPPQQIQPQHVQQQQQQQVHHQQQQPPPQQHHQPQQQQGHPEAHHQPHHHGHQQQLLGSNVNDEKAHIAEHMDVPMDTSKMSEQELQFHYFKMHDADNNNKLDGCELIKSLIHWHEQGSKEHQHDHHQPKQPGVEEKIFTDEELMSLIDPILTMDDYTSDGFIDYPEFVRAQQKAAQSNARDANDHHPQQAQPNP